MVLAIADAFGGNTWRRISKMELILQALTYPEIGRIISSDANFDLPTYQSQVRGAVAQGADLIVGYNDFGDAMAPTFKDAQDAGAFVTVYVGPVPSAGADSVVTQVVTDTCGAGTAMADAAIELTGGEGKVAFFNGTPGNPQGACVEPVRPRRVHRPGRRRQADVRRRHELDAGRCRRGRLGADRHG